MAFGKEDKADGDRIPPVAAWLGAAGLIPFVAGAGLYVYAALGNGDGLDMLANAALVGYGAIILSFMGGVQWGLAVARSPTDSAQPLLSNLQLVVSVIPALLGFACLPLLNNPHGFMVLALGFAALLTFDLWTVRRGWAPGWYGRLRIWLTAVVVACLFVAFVAWNWWVNHMY